MKYILILLIYVCITSIHHKDNLMVEKIVSYRSFYKAGTTALLKNVFEFPLRYNIDTAFKYVKDKDIDDFEYILNNAKVCKHKQMKINVDLALIVTILNKEHYFIISESSYIIVDLTTNLNYKLNTIELQEKSKKFVQNVINIYE